MTALVAEARRLIAEATKGPYTWEPPIKWPAEGDNGRILGANGETVCHFGDSTQYYPSEGDPPSDADLALWFFAVNALPALLDVAEAAEKYRAAERLHGEGPTTPGRRTDRVEAGRVLDAALAKLKEVRP